MAIAEVSIIPVGTGSPSVSRYVARAVTVLQQEKDVKYELTPMGTVIEGDLNRILALVEAMHQTAFDEGALRVVTRVEIDDRRDKSITGQSKLDSVMKKLEK